MITHTHDHVYLADTKSVPQAGLLIASGPDTNECNAIQAEWLITKQVEGKPFQETKSFIDNKNDEVKCNEVIETAVGLVVNAAKAFHAKTGFSHNDLHPDNVLFDDNLTKASLIDFGKARRNTVVSFQRLHWVYDR